MKSAIVVLSIAALCITARAADNAVVGTSPTAKRQSAVANPQSLDAITIPQMLSYQGKLTDTFGVPVADTTYSVEFRLYAAPSGGSPFWNETQTVRTRVGLFSTLLGSVTPIGSMPDAGAAYLGMAVEGGTELAPRLRIASAAYSCLAARAANADLLQGKDTTALDARYVNEAQVNSVSSAMIANGTIAAADLGQMGASSGQVMKWTGSVWAPRNDSVGSGGGDGDSAWVRGTPDSVLFTIHQLGIARGGSNNALLGAGRQTHINFGEGCTTGVTPVSMLHCVVVGGQYNAATNSGAAVVGGTANKAWGQTSFVGGGAGNRAEGLTTTVSGGNSNVASGPMAGIGSGWANSAGSSTDTAATVAGGKLNRAAGAYSFVGGGIGNRTNGQGATVAGGGYDSAYGDCATVAGGMNNNAASDFATVAGGNCNTATSSFATVAGGNYNDATGQFSTVGGGNFNDAAGQFAVVGGGDFNVASGDYATVAGGSTDSARALYGLVGGGYRNRAGDAVGDTAAVVVGGWENTANGKFGFIGGGYQHTAYGNYAAVAGGFSNVATGDYSAIAGGQSNTVASLQSAIGGGYSNFVGGDPSDTAAVVAGGRENWAAGKFDAIGGGYQNNSSNNYSTIAGGRGNTANGPQASVGGGWGNVASGWHSVAAGGLENVAAGTAATVSGGEDNLADGYWPSVAGGRNDTCHADYSMLAGYNVRARASADYTLAFGENCSTSVPRAVVFYHSGAATKLGVGVQTPTHYVDVTGGSYCDASGWHNGSSRELKHDIAKLTPEECRAILQQLLATDVARYKYKLDERGQEHVGLIAEEAPDVLTGPERKAIGTGDAIGFLMAAVKAQQAEIEQLKAELERR